MRLQKQLDNTLNSFFKLLRQNFLPLSKISITANAHFKNSDFEDKISPKEEEVFTYAILIMQIYAKVDYAILHNQLAIYYRRK